MSIFDVTQADTDAAVDVMLNAPPPPTVAPKSNAWSVVPRFVGAAAGEMAAAAGEAVKGYGRVMGASGAENAGGMFSLPNPTERTDQERAAVENEQGIKTRNAVSDSFRNVANEYRPDPLTASTAEQYIFGIGKGLTKAAGYMAFGGGVVGAGLLGFDEGTTATDDLQRQGVDDGTAVAVGALTGVVTAGTAMLPVAGQGLKSTAALVAVGGPGAFAAQQLANRKILEQANYSKIAEQYDPLDPVGLTLATVIPAAFGGLHLARMRGADGKFAPEAVRPAATEAPTVAAGIEPEVMDAAMVHNLTLAQDVRAARDAEPDRSAMTPFPADYVDDGFNVNQDARAYTMNTVDAVAEAQRLVGWDRFQELAEPHAQARPGDTWDAEAAARVELVARKVVDFYERKGEAPAPPVNPAPDIPEQVDAPSRPRPEPEAQTTPPKVDEEVAAIRQRAASIEAQNPEAAAELQRVRAEATNGTDAELGASETHLVQAAAECFLSLGT